MCDGTKTCAECGERFPEGIFLRIVHRHIGPNARWEYTERKNVYGPTVLIFALTKDKHVVLERNFRYPSQTYTYELPAGLMDHQNETPEEAARRELREETGFGAKEFLEVYAGPMGAAWSSDKIKIFFAKDAEFVGPPTPDDEEKIEVLLVPFENLEWFILNSEKDNIPVNLRLLGTLQLIKHSCLIGDENEK